MNDNRKFKRFTVEGMHGNMLFASEVNIVNISLGGAAVEADKRLNMNRTYTLKLQDEDTRIALKGTVVWSVISGNRPKPGGDSEPLYRAGLQFSGMSPERADELSSFLEKHKMRTDEGEMPAADQLVRELRFVIHTGQSAILDYPFNYEVRKISMGGMLIEADMEFKVEDRFPMEIFLGGIPVEFQGRVASCIPLEGEEQGCFKVGIEFIEMAEDSRAALRNFIDSLE